MLFDKVLLATLKFSIYGVHILNKLVFIVSKTCIKEPKRSMSQRELLYNLCAQSNLLSLNSLEHQISQLYIKVIESYGIFKSTIRLKLMHSLVCLHRTKVLDKTKIADLSKKFCSLG